MLGLYLILQPAFVLSRVGVDVGREAALWIVALVVLYAGVEALTSSIPGGSASWIAAILALVPAGVAFSFGGAARLGVIAFLGGSLLVAGIRGDPGCEVTAIPGMIRRRAGQLPCVVLSPVDALERRLREADGGSRK